MSMGVVRRRIKRKVKGEVRVVSREEYDGLDMSGKVELIRALVPLGLERAMEMLKEEVESLVGKRWDRRMRLAGHVRGGSNPGTVMLAGQRVPVRVPRVRDGRRNREVALKSYRSLRAGAGQVDEVLLRRVLYGLSCRNYELAAEAVPGAIGLSSSTVSRRFREATAARLREFKARDLSGYEFVALFVDGKSFADDEMVVALGVTVGGEKMLLDFVETSTENEKACLGLFEA
ncbi:MAG: transposase, partial [Candidatus Eisenbacteria bacterium]